MARQARQRSASGVYHIMCRGNSQMQIFHDDADNLTFLRFLAETVNNDFQVVAYCLMGNHFHLLVVTNKEKEDILESKMKSLLVRYVDYYNRRYERVGILFQNRFKSQPVETVPYFCRLIRYIHNNPVAAKICTEMDEYPWSSYRNYFFQDDATKAKYFFVNKEYALSLHTLEWYRVWHKQKEDNISGFLDVNTSLHNGSRSGDGLAADRFEYIFHFKINELSAKDEVLQRKCVRRMCIEQGFMAKQVARLSGIPKGIVDRYLL